MVCGWQVPIWIRSGCCFAACPRVECACSDDAARYRERGVKLKTERDGLKVREMENDSSETMAYLLLLHAAMALEHICAGVCSSMCV